VGHKLMVKEKLGLVRSLRATHLRADFVQEPIQNLEDLQEFCSRMGIGYLVVMKEAESGMGGPGSAVIRVRYWDKTQDKYAEKKLALSDVATFVQEKRMEESGSKREDSIGPGTSAGVGGSQFDGPADTVPSNLGGLGSRANVPAVTSNVPTNKLSNLRVHFAVTERPPHHIRKRIEGQMGNVLQNVLQKFSPKETLDAVATDIPGPAVKQLAAMGEFGRDEGSFRASITEVTSRFNKYKKELRLVVDQICDLKFLRTKIDNSNNRIANSKPVPVAAES